MPDYISRTDAAARMFGTGSPQHEAAKALDAAGAKPLPVAKPAVAAARSAAWQDDALSLEQRLVALSAGEWLDQVDELRAILAAGGPGIRALVLSMLAPEVEGLAAVALADAVDLGVERGSTAIGAEFKAKDEKAAAKVANRTGAARGALVGLDEKIADAVRTARRLASAGADDVAIVAPLSRARNDTKAALTWAANRAMNEGTLASAKRAKLPVVWVGERDACQHCLKLSGVVADSGDEFDWQDTYAAAPLSKPPVTLDAPPRHPNCRCHLEPLNHPSYAAALRREADRSILRGWSLESESEAARVVAAQRLLASGVTAPASVKAAAKAAVREGRFPSRTVPNG
jgi:hypothetical protein